MNNSKVHLEAVTIDNWKACASLAVAPGQEHFVPGNLYSIAESQFYEHAKSRAIYNAQDQLVGYALFGHDIFTNKWKIFRIMIDQAYQGHGYGESAMHEMIRQIAAEPNGNEILICYQNDNQVARRLYAKLGFVEQEIDEGGKVTAFLRVLYL